MLKVDKQLWRSHVSYQRNKVKEENEHLKYLLENQKKSIQALIERQIELSKQINYYKSQLC